MTTLSPPATPVAMPRSDTENPVFETEKSGADGGDGGSNYVESWVPRELRITDLPFMRGIQTYKTIKYQVVEEPMLALLAFVVKITVLIYVTILMTHYHTYNATASPTSVISTWASSGCNAEDPPKCSFQGSDESFCAGAGPAGADYICATGWEYLDNVCRDMLPGEVTRKSPTTMEIVTYATTSTKGAGGNVTKANYFTPHVDLVPVTLQHSFAVPDAVGFDAFRPGPIYARTVVYDSDGGVFKVFPAPEAGGSITVTLSVAEWLALSGIPSLDTPNEGAVTGCSAAAGEPLWAPARVPTYRLTGVAVDVTVDTQNDKLGVSNMGSAETVTEIRVKRTGGDWNSFGSQIAYLSSYPDEVVDAYQYGLRINFVATGKIAVFDFSVLMNSVTTYLVMLGFASVVGDFALSWVFGQKSKVYKDAKHDLLDKSEIEVEHQYKLAEIAAKAREHALTIFDKYAATGVGDGADGTEGVVSVAELETIVLELEDKELESLQGKDEEGFAAALADIIRVVDEGGDGEIDKDQFITWWVARKQAESE